MALCNTWEEARDRLRKIREEQARRSDEVIDLWEYVLGEFSDKLGNEVWVIYEQVCVAAADCGRLDIAKDCYQSLLRQFPDSSRIAWLKGLLLESNGDYDRARQHYEDIVKKDDTNALAWKRKIAICKSQDGSAEAAKQLNLYLQKHMSDMEAWLELCDLHLQELDYQRAAFCMEELLLSNPYNHLIHQKYAEIKYTQGGEQNMVQAKKYFGQAIKLNPNNMRALFGFYLSANYLSQSSKGTGLDGKSKKDNAEYASAAWRQIVAKYQGKAMSPEAKQLQAVKGMFENLQITSSSSSSP